MSAHWKETRVSADGTHHIGPDGTATYDQRFDWVLAYHDPGIAPAADDSGSYHIDGAGVPCYEQRFARTFGFYCNRAAVDDGADR